MEQTTVQALRRATFRIAASTVEAKLATLMLLLKAGFRAEQPRVPAGTPEGGRWTDEAIPASDRGPRGNAPRRVRGRWQNITPDQEARLAVSQGEMQAALRAVRRLDPTWKPRPNLYESVEGEIASNNAVAREARTQIYVLTVSPPGAGPFAKEWVTAPPNYRLNKGQQSEINRLGRIYGCHWCGTKSPKTRSGNFVGDHQLPRSVGTPTRIYPHCLTCSSSQGGSIRSRGRGTKNAKISEDHISRL